MTTSLTEQMLSDDAQAVVLVRGLGPEKQPIYAYVGVQVGQLDTFMEAQTQGNFDPKQYGTILEAGEGEPDDTVRNRMEKEYGFNHDKMVTLPPPEKT